MIKLELVKPGDVLYDVHRERAGNTTMSRLGWWRVVVKSVDLQKQSAVISWNGNKPHEVHARAGKLPYRRSIPKKLARNGDTRP